MAEAKHNFYTISESRWSVGEGLSLEEKMKLKLSYRRPTVDSGRLLVQFRSVTIHPTRSPGEGKFVNGIVEWDTRAEMTDRFIESFTCPVCMTGLDIDPSTRTMDHVGSVYSPFGQLCSHICHFDCLFTWRKHKINQLKQRQDIAPYSCYFWNERMSCPTCRHGEYRVQKRYNFNDLSDGGQPNIVRGDLINWIEYDFIWISSEPEPPSLNVLVRLENPNLPRENRTGNDAPGFPQLFQERWSILRTMVNDITPASLSETTIKLFAASMSVPHYPMRLDRRDRPVSGQVMEFVLGEVYTDGKKYFCNVISSRLDLDDPCVLGKVRSALAVNKTVSTKFLSEVKVWLDRYQCVLHGTFMPQIEVFFVTHLVWLFYGHDTLSYFTQSSLRWARNQLEGTETGERSYDEFGEHKKERHMETRISDLFASTRTTETYCSDCSSSSDPLSESDESDREDEPEVRGLGRKKQHPKEPESDVSESNTPPSHSQSLTMLSFFSHYRLYSFEIDLDVLLQSLSERKGSNGAREVVCPDNREFKNPYAFSPDSVHVECLPPGSLSIDPCSLGYIVDEMKVDSKRSPSEPSANILKSYAILPLDMSPDIHCTRLIKSPFESPAIHRDNHGITKRAPETEECQNILLTYQSSLYRPDGHEFKTWIPDPITCKISILSKGKNSCRLVLSLMLSAEGLELIRYYRFQTANDALLFSVMAITNRLSVGQVASEFRRLFKDETSVTLEYEPMAILSRKFSEMTLFKMKQWFSSRSRSNLFTQAEFAFSVAATDYYRSLASKPEKAVDLYKKFSIYKLIGSIVFKCQELFFIIIDELSRLLSDLRSRSHFMDKLLLVFQDEQPFQMSTFLISIWDELYSKLIRTPDLILSLHTRQTLFQYSIEAKDVYLFNYLLIRFPNMYHIDSAGRSIMNTAISIDHNNEHAYFFKRIVDFCTQHDDRYDVEDLLESSELADPRQW